MADPHAADASGQSAAPMSRRERREAERRAAREAAARELDLSAPAVATAEQNSTDPAAGGPALIHEPEPDTAPTPAPALDPEPLADIEPGSRPEPEPDDAGQDDELEQPSDEPEQGDTGEDDEPEPAHDEPGTGHEAPGPVADGTIPEPPAPQPRGGRNVPAAIGVGLGLGLLVVASLFFWRKEAFLGLAIVACGLALWELSTAVRVRDIRLPLLPLMVGTIGMMVSAYTAGTEALLVACVLTSGGAFIWRVLDGGGLPALRDATAAVFATAYVPFLAGFIALMLAADDGPWRVLTYVAVCVASDTGGYAAGVLFGRTRLAPVVSPKKSWEGLIGSYVVAALVGVGMFIGPLDGPWWGGLALGVAGVTVATLGDLAESLLKRDLGVKDMGNLLPGHGGVLDRVDSLLFAAPVAFVVFYVVLGSGR